MATLVDTFGVSADTSGFPVSRGPSGLEPAVMFDGVNFVAAWTDSNPAGRDVYIARIDPDLGLIDTNSIPAATTAEIEGGPAVAGGPSGAAAVLFQRYAPAPWMCTRAWAAVYTEQTGVEEHRTLDASRSALNATVIRGVLNLPRDAGALGHDPNCPGAIGSCPAALLDAAGRTVLTLRAGANDVSGFAPGVYFIRARGSRGQGFQGYRVVIAK